MWEDQPGCTGEASVNDLTLEYQTSDSASSSKFNNLALLVALVLHLGDSGDFNFAIL